MTKGPPSPEQAPTASQAPVLTTNDEVAAFVSDMQTTNSGCELPCWWRIIPGKTMLEEAQQILSPLRNYAEYDEHALNPVMALYRHLFNNYFNMKVELDAVKGSNRTIRLISVDSFIPNNDVSSYPDNWHRYDVCGLRERLGQPSEVWFGLGPLTGDADPHIVQPPGEPFANTCPIQEVTTLSIEKFSATM